MLLALEWSSWVKWWPSASRGSALEGAKNAPDFSSISTCSGALQDPGVNLGKLCGSSAFSAPGGVTSWMCPLPTFPDLSSLCPDFGVLWVRTLSRLPLKSLAQGMLGNAQEMDHDSQAAAQPKHTLLVLCNFGDFDYQSQVVKQQPLEHLDGKISLIFWSQIIYI